MNTKKTLIIMLVLIGIVVFCSMLGSADGVPRKRTVMFYDADGAEHWLSENPGYVLCNHTNSLIYGFVPDMSSRFVKGYNETLDDLGETGGNSSYTLSENHLPIIDLDDYMKDPGHSHSIFMYNAAGIGATGVQTSTPAQILLETASSATGITFDSFGGGEAFNNQPSFIVMGFATKIGNATIIPISVNDDGGLAIGITLGMVLMFPLGLVLWRRRKKGVM